MSRFFEITKDKVLAFALLTVAVSSGFVMWMQHRLISILSAPEWCVRAINAEQLAQVRSTSQIGTSCAAILDKQVGSLAVALYIDAGIVALCLAVLMVIVVAGGRLKFSASAEGVDADISRDPVAAAARQTADAAVEEAKDIADDMAN